MQHLTIAHLTFAYPHAPAPVFEELTLTFPQGWSCIVGANGSGKTTLMKLIAGVLRPQSGTLSGNDLVTYCEQRLDAPPENAETFAQAYDARAFRIKETLGIDDAWFYRWESLSFGEKKRLQVGAALFSDPDILLLDEPTNHLDRSAKAALLAALRAFGKTGILISHDREFLDTLCTTTFIVKNHRVTKYKSAFSNAMQELARERDALAHRSEEQNRQIKKLRHAIVQQKEKVARSDARLSKRHIDKHDRDAKERINLARLTGKDRGPSRLVDTLGSRYEQLEAKKVRTEKEYAKGVTFEATASKSRSLLVDLEAGTLPLGEFKRLSYPAIRIGRSDRIALVGDNGSGKSSFVARVVAGLDRDDLLYLPQEIDDALASALFEAIRTLPNDKKGELYTFVTRLSSDPKLLLDNSTPSPGELRKLLIAEALLENVGAIVLDEPTNHMDIDSIIALEEALSDYPGMLFLISHDPLFVERVGATLWHIVREGEESCRLMQE